MKAAFVVALVLVLLGGAGCVPIDGGSVEVSWAVWTSDGRGAIGDCSCADPAIAYVQLKLAGPPDNPDQPDPCEGNAACRFSCGSQDGATPFIFNPGSYLMSIEPLAVDGTVLTGDMVPDPIVGQVTKGLSHDLGAFLIQAPCAARCHGADLTRACSAD